MAPITKPTPITGFPEFLPQERIVEQRVLDTLRNAFERHGFCSIETPAVERLDVLLSKGADTDKEMYILTRLQAEEKEEAKLGMHFDLTVPFARYVAQHENELTFPFKRYQVQPVWRGERPKLGRFRQFKQFDIDVINRENVSLEYDAYLPAILCNAVQEIGIKNTTLNISNRKILQGFLNGLGIENYQDTIHMLDKILKIGEAAVTEELTKIGLSQTQIQKSIQFMKIKSTDNAFVEQIKALGVETDLLTEGLNELSFCMETFKKYSNASIVANMAIIRGLDYYTGSVFELYLDDIPELDAIGGGGRYENLASSMTKTKLPGVGMTFGITRLLGVLFKRGWLPENAPKSKTQVLIVRVEKDDLDRARAIAKTLQDRGINAEMYIEGGKLAKQMKYANDKAIPYVWFDIDNNVRDMRTGEQTPADPKTWTPK